MSAPALANKQTRRSTGIRNIYAAISTYRHQLRHYIGHYNHSRTDDRVARRHSFPCCTDRRCADDSHCRLLFRCSWHSYLRGIGEYPLFKRNLDRHNRDISFEILICPDFFNSHSSLRFVRRHYHKSDLGPVHACHLELPYSKRPAKTALPGNLRTPVHCHNSSLHYTLRWRVDIFYNRVRFFCHDKKANNQRAENRFRKV